MIAAPTLVPRSGSLPAFDESGSGGWQRDQRSAPTMWVAVWDSLRSVPGVIAGSSATGEDAARAVLVPSVINPVAGTSFAPAGLPLEPAHLHSPADTSIHLVLPHARAALVVAQRWARPCPLAVHGTELIVFGPRDEAELAIVAGLARESVMWALARNSVTTYRRHLATPTSAPQPAAPPAAPSLAAAAAITAA